LSEDGKVYEATKVALDEGYRHIDEAWIYGNEEEVGRALKEKFAEGKIKREDVFVTSKLWNCFHRPELVKEGLMESLKKLQLDYVDLYLMHFPVSFIPGCSEATEKHMVEEVPLKDTWVAMEALVDEGLVKNIGVSNFEIEHLDEIRILAKKPIAVNQFECHPYYQRNELADWCRTNGMVVIAHTSLGSPGNCMSDHHTSPPLMEDPVIKRIAAEHGKDPSHILLRWSIQKGNVVIPKSVTPSRIASNAELFDFELSE
jgi:aldehyde reductase